MRHVFATLTLLVLAGCYGPPPSDGAVKAVSDSCIAKGLTTKVYITTNSTSVECVLK